MAKKGLDRCFLHYDFIGGVKHIKRMSPVYTNQIKN